MGNFRQLKVWQVSKALAVEVYMITNNSKGFEKDFRFRDQLRAASVSIPSNLAEGDELGSNKQSVRHFFIAKGSTAELITQLIIASEIGYITEEVKAKLVDTCEHISSMINKLIIARKTATPPPR